MKEITQSDLARINSRLMFLKCPSCGSKELTIQSQFFCAPVLYNNEVRIDNVLPLLAIVCNHCGHIDFHNPNILLGEKR